MKTITVLALALTLPSMALAQSSVASPAALPEVDHMVYLSFLPEPDDLMADAKANGLTILRLDKTTDRVVVSYKYPDGHTATLGYALLGSNRSSDRVKERPVEVVERTTTVVEREPEIVYVERPYRERVIYRERYDNAWLPLTIGLGVGYLAGHNHHYHYPRYHYRSSWNYRHGGHHGHYRGHRGRR